MNLEKKYEPYFGWCDVLGCENEGCSGGNAWSDSGYWAVCTGHAQDYRDGKPQPKMKTEVFEVTEVTGEDEFILEEEPISDGEFVYVSGHFLTKNTNAKIYDYATSTNLVTLNFKAQLGQLVKIKYFYI